jgi:hypothetical protein
MGKTKNDTEVKIIIKSKTITYSGTVSIRKAHKILQVVADEEKQAS